MSQPTLTATYTELRGQCGHFLGYGRDPDAWDATQTDDVDMVLRGGLRMFYNCGFDWSFLKPVTTLTLAEGDNAVRLPDDYAQADGPIQVGVAGEGTYYHALALGPWQPIFQAELQQPDRTGIPQYAHVRPLKGTSQLAGQRFELRVYPTADQDYSLTFAYRLNADALAANLPFAYGGAQHSQTLLQACKAAAERDLDDIAPGSPAAAQHAAYVEMLEASKRMDRRSKPQTVGRNLDRSDRYRRGRQYVGQVLPPILVDGVLYD